MNGVSDQTIPVHLSRQQWEHTLILLARQPFNEVASLIGEIQRQCQMHEMRVRAAQQMPMQAPEDYGPLAARGNGEVRPGV